MTICAELIEPSLKTHRMTSSLPSSALSEIERVTTNGTPNWWHVCAIGAAFHLDSCYAVEMTENLGDSFRVVDERVSRHD